MVKVPEMDAFEKHYGMMSGLMSNTDAVMKPRRKSSRIEAKKRAQVMVVPDILAKPTSRKEEEETDQAVPDLKDTFFDFNENTIFNNSKAANSNQQPDIFELQNWNNPYKLELDFDDILREWEDQTIYENLFGEQPSSTGMNLSESESKDSSNTILIDTPVISKDEFARNRKACLERYREKKRNRKFNKKVRYHLRKMNADRRPRYKGRFIKKGEVIPTAA